jgi:hypothetical protein
MGVKCDPAETTTSSAYSISEDGKTMTYEYNNPPAPKMTLNLTVDTLTEEKLDASGSLVSIPFQLVFVKK